MKSLYTENIMAGLCDLSGKEACILSGPIAKPSLTLGLLENGNLPSHPTNGSMQYSVIRYQHTPKSRSPPNTVLLFLWQSKCELQQYVPHLKRGHPSTVH